jgi:hypothetical protein
MAETPRTSERPEPKRAPIGKPMCNGGDLLYISLIYPPLYTPWKCLGIQWAPTF